MSTVAASNKNDFFEDNRNVVDQDDFTNSSIFDFLKKERECFNGARDGTAGTDDGSEIDVESLFEEINRLSDNTDDRSVDEILREAEILIEKQNPLPSSATGRGGGVRVGSAMTAGAGGDADRVFVCKKKGVVQGPSPPPPPKNVNHGVSTPPTDGQQSSQTRKQENFRKVVEAVCPDSTISQESAPNGLKTDVDDTTTSDSTDSIGTISLQIDEPPSNTDLADLPILSPTKTHSSLSRTHLIKANSPKHVIESIDLSGTPKAGESSKENAARTFNSVRQPLPPPPPQPRYCDRSTNSSPIHTISNTTSPIDNFSISREYALKHEIEVLQERLKDTEERLQSLRIQHDSLSHLHRDLRDGHGRLQEESELLKLDVQHLTECANILRNELQSARNDRNEALDVQKLLQAELGESRGEKRSAQEQCERDSKVIQDLQRQCKEMERILMRKHPDSVSALIVASKSPGRVNDDTSAGRRLLEQRIAQLESDAKEQDHKAQKILANVQARFNSVQSKYETHIADLETQVLSLQEINTKLNEKIESQMKLLNRPCHDDNDLINHGTQTEELPEKETNTPTRNTSTQTDTSRPNSSTATRIPSKKLPQINKMSVSHSDTTISNYHAAAKEDAHLLATIRGMRIDLALKDKAMQRLTRELEECKKTIKKLQREKDAIKSEKSSSSTGSTSRSKSYDPSQFAEHSSVDSQALKEALNKIKLLEHDYKALHDKRLQDLKTLQAAHERELASCHETVRVLQQRLAERDEATQKRRKVPIDYYALKAKVSSLERRHSEREQRLHMLVEALSKGRLNGTLDEILTDNGQ